MRNMGRLTKLADNGDGTFTVIGYNSDYADASHPPWNFVLVADASGEILWYKAYLDSPGVELATKGPAGDIYAAV